MRNEGGKKKKTTESITYYKIALKMLLFEQHINDSTIWDVQKYRFLAHVMVNKKVYLPVNMTSETMYFLKSNNSSRYNS